MFVTLRKVKSFPAREGMATDCDIFVDGKHVAHYHDAGDGGEPQAYAASAETARAFADLERAIEALPPIPPTEDTKSLFPNGMPASLDGMVAKALDDHEIRKQIKRWCKTQVVCRYKDDPGALHTFKAKYSPEYAKAIRAGYPQITEILNETISKNPQTFAHFIVPEPQAVTA